MFARGLSGRVRGKVALRCGCRGDGSYCDASGMGMCDRVDRVACAGLACHVILRISVGEEEMPTARGCARERGGREEGRPTKREGKTSEEEQTGSSQSEEAPANLAP